MHHELVVLPDADGLAHEGAREVTEIALAAVEKHGSFRMAVSGGRTPWGMFAVLDATPEFPWDRTELFQVDERLVPIDDPARNLAQLRALVPETCTIVPMPVEALDPEKACADYAEVLPSKFDLIHLGLGSDGHTASLVPDDSSLAVRDRMVALTGSTYQGHRRMTLTYPALRRTDRLIWLVSGADKREALQRLLAADPTIPAGRVEAPMSVVLADTAAAGRA